jgi:TnpA family transposase
VYEAVYILDGLINNQSDIQPDTLHGDTQLRVVISIKAGKIAPSTILRRLGTASRKNKLYYAFRELGRVQRTMLLLKYISDAGLRRTIHAATNNPVVLKAGQALRTVTVRRNNKVVSQPVEIVETGDILAKEKY